MPQLHARLEGAEGAAYGGREVYAEVPAASEAELLELSKLMNTRLQHSVLFPDAATREWCMPALPR